MIGAHRMRCARIHRGARGFSLLEVVVAVSVVIAAISMIIPAFVAMTSRSNESTTQDQLETVHAAIFGDPSQGVFGFVGDMGRLPATLAELTAQGALPSFHTADGATPHAGNVGYGWNGPYLSSVFPSGDLTTDAWGQALSFSALATGGKTISAGRDGTLGTSDDITYPAHNPPVTGTLYPVVVANGIANPFGAAVKVYYPVNGEQVVTPTQKFDPNEPFATFDGFAFTVPAGVRVVTVSHTGQGDGGGGCGTVTRTVPVNVVPGRANVIEIRMITGAVVRVTGSFNCTIPD